MSNTSNKLLFFYREAVLQLGYLAFFACAFTLAPLFCIITNLIEVQIKLNSMAEYSRRFKADMALGIGAWNRVLRAITILAIPINMYIILLAGEDKFGKK